MFIKYPSIDNIEKKKTIERVIAQFPQLQTEQFYVQEKIDGSNIQFFLDENNEIYVGKRSCFIDRNENFHGIWETFDRFYGVIYDLAITLKNEFNSSTVRLYGELFGPGVQNRIDYGNNRQIQIFDAMVDDNPVPWNVVLDSDMNNLCVYHYTIIDYDEAINYDPSNHVSHYSPSNQKAEGVVIKPAYPYIDKGSGKLIAFKSKREDFEEKGGKPKKENSSKNDMSEEGKRLKEEFESYITKNRIHSVFSKEGEIEDESQIGNFIKLLTEDAKEEFFQDWGDDFKALPDKEKKTDFQEYRCNCSSYLKRISLERL